ncbi:Cell cycle checkpoint protein RAD17 [Smittium culicis]|uniref:Cell cycle checkpoint protein RAD17 n=1 Tax=Smittium culicis TaxID=133412 RepID=A0A1R1Y514_9FUNG|nr:Cell cycle checkpoint protein RAD17 [Smittium culicis]
MFYRCQFITVKLSFYLIVCFYPNYVFLFRQGKLRFSLGSQRTQELKNKFPDSKNNTSPKDILNFSSNNPLVTSDNSQLSPLISRKVNKNENNRTIKRKRTGRKTSVINSDSESSESSQKKNDFIHQDELAVHPKKVEQVYSWLNNALYNPKYNPYNRLLLLLGPTGSGKTAVVRSLASELDYDIIEWVNSVNLQSINSPVSNYDEIGVSKQFSNFLQQAQSYSSLNLTSSLDNLEINLDPTKEKKTSNSQKNRKKVILLEDIPNFSNFETHKNFIKSISSFIRTPAFHSYPLIIAFSDSSTNSAFESIGSSSNRRKSSSLGNRLLSTNSSEQYSNKFDSSDISSIYDILPSSILDSDFCQKILFNPVANTILLKLLIRTTLHKLSELMNHNSLVLSTGLDPNSQPNANNLIQLRISGTAESELKKIAEHVGGDIRSALNNLQIIWPSVEISKLDCNNGISSLTKSLNLNPLHMLSVSQNSNSSHSSETDLNSSQQSSSSLFKTFGIKFDFNKKKTSSLGSKKLISHENIPNIASGDRGQLEYDTKNLLQYIPVDLDIFSLYLHQNYPYFTCEVDEHADISDYFSICDLFSNTGSNYPNWIERFLNGDFDQGNVHSSQFVPIKNENFVLSSYRAGDSDNEKNSFDDDIEDSD